MRFMKYLFPIIIIVVAIGCGTKDPLSPATPTTPYIMPLKVGYQWTYDLKTYDPGPTPSYDYTYYVRIDSSVAIGDETWYRARLTIEDDNSGTYDTMYTYYYINRDDGLWIRQSPGSTAYIRAKYTAPEGNVYTGFSEFWGSGASITVADTNLTVSIPQGNYKCYWYQFMVSSTLEINEYYQVNTGMVSTIWRSYDGASWYNAVVFQLQSKNF